MPVASFMNHDYQQECRLQLLARRGDSLVVLVNKILVSGREMRPVMLQCSGQGRDQLVIVVSRSQVGGKEWRPESLVIRRIGEETAG